MSIPTLKSLINYQNFLNQLEEDYFDGQLLAKLEIVDTGTLDTMVRDINTKQTETYSHEFRAEFKSEIDFKRAIVHDFE